MVNLSLIANAIVNGQKEGIIELVTQAIIDVKKL
jgi:hypothetical protein